MSLIFNVVVNFVFPDFKVKIKRKVLKPLGCLAKHNKTSC